jgi:hypothetical protein
MEHRSSTRGEGREHGDGRGTGVGRGRHAYRRLNATLISGIATAAFHTVLVIVTTDPEYGSGGVGVLLLGARTGVLPR